MSNLEPSKPINIKCKTADCESHEIYRGRFCKECCRFNSRMYYRRAVMLRQMQAIAQEASQIDAEESDDEINV